MVDTIWVVYTNDSDNALAEHSASRVLSQEEHVAGCVVGDAPHTDGPAQPRLDQLHPHA